MAVKPRPKPLSVPADGDAPAKKAVIKKPRPKPAPQKSAPDPTSDGDRFTFEQLHAIITRNEYDADNVRVSGDVYSGATNGAGLDALLDQLVEQTLNDADEAVDVTPDTVSYRKVQWPDGGYTVWSVTCEWEYTDAKA